MAEHVAQYFQGERREMLAIITGSVLLTIVVVGFFLVVRDSFSKGLLVTVTICAALLVGTAASLLSRDAKLCDDLLAVEGSAQAHVAIVGERARVEAIIARYKYYRYGAAALGLLALAMLVASRRGWATGTAMGLLLLVLAQVMIDHYSEARAHHYLSWLQSQ